MTYKAERHEVEALLRDALGGILAEADPLTRYEMLTREQALYDALVSEIKRHRGKALAELRNGRTLEQVADLAQLGSRQRVEKLITASVRRR